MTILVDFVIATIKLQIRPEISVLLDDLTTELQGGQCRMNALLDFGVAVEEIDHIGISPTVFMNCHQ